jgi:16S rRNA G966 N2-methylase RsmD
VITLSENTKAFISAHENEDVYDLALKASRYPDIDMGMAIAQIKGRQIAKAKVPSWYNVPGILYPPHLSLEQCSSERTALYKSSLLSGKSMADLTGGMGVDCSFLSHNFDHVTYIDCQEDLCEIAFHNFSVLGLTNIDVKQQDSVQYLQSIHSVDVIYLDPARRNNHGQKVFAIADCEPNIVEIKDLLLSKSNRVLIKLSPMLDLYEACLQLPCVRQIHVVSSDNECKELLFLLDKERTENPSIYCINLMSSGVQSFVFNREEEASVTCQYTDDVKAYLYEPNASILKAGAYKVLAQRFDLLKLHPNSHLYTSDNFLPDFPGRVFSVVACSNFSKKEIKQLLSEIGKANITVRNFPKTVKELYRQFHILEGGDDYLFATTTASGKHLIIHCKRERVLK